MKKLMTTLLAVLMVFGCAVTSVAAEDTADTTDTVTVSYEVDQTYSWSAPEDIEFASFDDDSQTGTVTISNAVIKEGSKVQITVSSENYSNGWKMVRSDDDSIVLGYDMKISDVTVDNEGVVLECEPSDTVGEMAEATATLSFAINDANKAGSFEDTLTFAATIVVPQ